MIVTTLFFVGGGVRLFFAAKFIGGEPDLWQVIVIHLFLSATLVVSLTPGNLGIREGGIYFIATYLGGDANSLVLAGLVDRVAGLIPTLLVGGMSFWSLSNEAVKKHYLAEESISGEQ